MIGTHGRGFYVLDNIGVLRQATPELTTSNLFVFETFNPLRGRDRNVTFDYYLGKDAGEVKIEFLDAAGRGAADLHRHAQAGRHGPARGHRCGDGGVLRHHAGARRRGEGHEPLHLGPALRGRHGVPRHDHVGCAAAARAGRAAREVHRADHRQRRDEDAATSRSGIDPRLLADGVTEANLQEQFKLSVQVRDRVTAANMAVVQIRGIRDQINQRLEKVNPRRKAEIQKLADGVLTAAGVGGAAGLPGSEPEQPGPAQLPDHAEQQDRGADGRHRERGQPADRSRPTRCSRSCPRRSTRSCRRRTPRSSRI